MKKEELKQFNKVIDEVLLPIIDENQEDIDKILDQSPKFKRKVETKVDEILSERKKRKEIEEFKNLLEEQKGDS